MAIALLIRFFEKWYNKAMVIFSTNKKNTGDKFSPPPSPQKNNGPSLSCTLGPTRSSGGGIGVLGDSTDSDLSGGSVLLQGY